MALRRKDKNQGEVALRRKPVATSDPSGKKVKRVGKVALRRKVKNKGKAKKKEKLREEELWHF